MADDELLQGGGAAQDSDIAELRRAWINEKASPEVLQCAPRPSHLFAALLLSALLVRCAADGRAFRAGSSWSWCSG